MKRKIKILLLLLVISVYSLAQIPSGCNVSGLGSNLGDNALEVKMIPSISEEGGKKFYVCEFHLRKMGDWYAGMTTPIPPLPFNYTSDLSALYIYCTPTVEQFIGLPVATYQKNISYYGAIYSIAELAPPPATECGYIDGSTTTTADRWFHLNFTIKTAFNIFATTTDYWHIATVKWELAASASGEVGLIGRDHNVKLHGSNSTNLLDGTVGFCFSTSGLVDVGGGSATPPEITKVLASSGKACSGMSQEYTATVTGEYESINWRITNQSGVDVTASVATITPGSKDKVTVNWKADAVSGAYNLCGVPVSAAAGNGNEYCESITLYTTPTISIAYDNSVALCAGQQVTLKPQLVYGANVPVDATSTNVTGSQWTVQPDPATVATSITYSPTLTTSEKTYKYAATLSADRGSCPVSGTIALKGNSAPNVNTISKTLVLSGSTLSGDSYYDGDVIKLSVAANANWQYKWVIAGTTVSTTDSYTIYGATAASYSGNVVITDKTTQCSVTLPFNLTKSSNCKTTLAVSDNFGVTPVTICTGGIALLKAQATPTCGDIAVMCYVWLKEQGSSWVKKDSITTTNKTNIFAAKEAGKYMVRVYTSRGIHNATVTVTNSGNSVPALEDRLQAWDTVTVKSGSLVQLGASGVNINSYYWTPENMFTGGSNTIQYPKTTSAVSNDMKFYVYANYKGTKCTSYDSTQVVISNQALDVKILVANPVCKNSIVRAVAEVNGGTGHYTYKWDAAPGGYPTDGQEALMLASATSGYTRVVQVKDINTGVIGVAFASITVSSIEAPKFNFDGITNNQLCQKAVVTLKNQNSTTISSYTWYIKDQNGVMTTRTSADNTYSFAERGNYTIWVAATSAGNPSCYSDTVNTKTTVQVKGFDLAWGANRPTGGYFSGQTLKVDANATNGSGYKFTWKSPVGGVQQGTNTTNPNAYELEGASAATYRFVVEATDANTCINTLDTTITKATGNLDKGLMLAVTDKSVNLCDNGTAVMGATATGGTGPYVFSWYKAGEESSILQGPLTVNGNGSAHNKFISATNYPADTKIVVKVVDNSSSLLIRRDTVLVKRVTGTAAPQIGAGEDMLIAKGSDTYLMGEIKSGTPTSWVWEDATMLASGAATQFPKTKILNSDITYKVYAIDANKCTSNTDEVNITVTPNPHTLAVTIDPVTTLCNGSKVTLNATVNPMGTTVNAWKWSAALGNFASTSKNPEYSVTSSVNTTTEIVVAVKDAQGVTATDKISVNVLKELAPVLQLSGFKAGDNLCSGESLKVSATNGVVLNSCVWYVDGTPVTGVTGNTYTPSVVSESYQLIKVTATSTANCPSAGAAEKQLTIYPKPRIAWDSVTPNPVAPGEDVLARIEVVSPTKPNYTYTWNHNSGGGNAAANYTDEGTTPIAGVLATSQVVGNASEGTQPYYFQVKVTDGNGCISNQKDTLVILDGSALLVNLASKYGEFCTGGSVVLEASVIGVNESDVQYTWYNANGDVVLAGEKGKTLLIKNPVAGDMYYVQAQTTGSNGKSGKSKTVELKANLISAAQLTGVDMKIPTNTKTALLATSTAPITKWQWSPDDKLATGESTYPSPYTKQLANSQTYYVYGVDNNGCVTNTATVDVSVIDVTPPTGTDVDQTLFVKAIPGVDTICVGNELALNTQTWGTVSGIPEYEWTPASNLSATNIVNPVFNSTNTVLPIGTYSYTVKVKKGILVAAARVDVVVVNGILPVLQKDASSLACAGSDLIMKVTNLAVADVKKYTWIINGAEDKNVTGNTYKWPAVAANTDFNVKVLVETKGHCRGSVAFSETVSPALPLDPLQVKDSCGQVILFANTGSAAQYEWKLNPAVSSLTLSNGKSNDTLYVTPNTAFTNPSIAYTVEVNVKPNGGGCASTGKYTGKLFYQPKAELALWQEASGGAKYPYTMAEKGQGADIALSSATPYNSTLTSISWNKLYANMDNSIKDKAILTNINKDDTISVLVYNKLAASCRATDTMPIYLYPEAPQLMIDTADNSMLKAQLKLTGIPGAQFTVWSRKWDPYCKTTRFSGDQVYKKETATPITSKLWKEPNMDTLEFYYATSSRTIQGKEWQSRQTSDTVGYYMQYVKYDPTIGALNYISYPFDMSAVMGGSMASDFITSILGNKRLSASYFDFNEQLWQTCIYLDLGGTDFLTGDFSIQAGGSYMVDGFTADKQIMMYGKLPSLTSYTLGTGVNGNLAPIIALIQYASYSNTKDILIGLGNSVGVYNWNFATQLFDATIHVFGDFYMGEVPLYPWMPLLAEPNGVSSITWH